MPDREDSPQGDSGPLRRNNVRFRGRQDAVDTMVFVHGFGTDQHAWHAVAAAFDDDYRQVLLDNVGAGGTDPKAFIQHHYLNLHGYAQDLISVCDAAGVRDAVMVGHSVGAMIGVLASVARPELFSRLVLIGASPRYLDDTDYHGGFTREGLDELYRSVTLDYARWAGSFAPLAMANPNRPRLAEHFAESLRTIPAETALTVLCSIFQSDHRAVLGDIKVPTLLIQSRDDVAVPLEVAQYLNARIAGSRLALIDATGHLPHVSAPDAVIAAMRAFL